jgi:hypothetical protein
MDNQITSRDRMRDAGTPLTAQRITASSSRFSPACGTASYGARYTWLDGFNNRGSAIAKSGQSCRAKAFLKSKSA